MALLATLTVSAPHSAASGSTLLVDTTLVVHSDGPRVVLQSAGSRLEVLRAGAVVATQTAAPGSEVPLPLTAGRTLPAQTVPASVPLVGCNGAPLSPGDYTVRAVLAYGNDPLNSAAGGAAGRFELVSEARSFTVT